MTDLKIMGIYPVNQDVILAVLPGEQRSSEGMIVHAFLCSLILVSSVRMVFPMYTLPQLQGTSYTTRVLFSSLNQLDPPRDTISIPYVEGLSEGLFSHKTTSTVATLVKNIRNCQSNNPFMQCNSYKICYLQE